MTEIVHQVNLPKSTVSRLLATLENLELVERARNVEGFCFGPGTTTLALGVPYAQYLLILTQPYLIELAQATNEAVNLCLPDKNQAYVVAHFPSQHHISL